MSLRQFYDSLPSTQLRAREMVAEGCPEGVWIVARVQTGGVGRLDHRWVSPPGGLYLSRIGRALTAAGPLVSLAFAAGLHDLLSDGWSVRTALKWPNDLLLPGADGRARKIAGILPEQVHGPHGPRTVVGVGLNVATPREAFPPELRDRIGRIADGPGPVPALDEVEARVLATLAQVEEELGTPAGRARWLDRAREILFGRGRPAWVDGVAVGRIREIAADGALLVDGANGPSSILAGELVVEERT
ncbi:MAG: biotin--[acetyl-CoA-carboxylase] ligase [Thermoplasmata archaeon]